MHEYVRMASIGKMLVDDNMPRLENDDQTLVQMDWSKKDRFFDDIEHILKVKGVSAEVGHIIPEYTPVSDQGPVSSCVANAAMDMLEILMGIEHGPKSVVQLSRMFAYWIARVLHKATDVDDGTYFRAMFQQARVIGVVEEDFFPHRLNTVFKAPELDLYMMASNNRIDGFYRIITRGSEKIQQIKTAISANHPVAYGIPVNEAFCRYQGGSQVWPGKMPNPIGNHAMLLTGWRAKGGKIEFWNRNSWGKKWGNGGRIWMDEDLIRDHAFDVWVGTKMNNLA